MNKCLMEKVIVIVLVILYKNMFILIISLFHMKNNNELVKDK